MKNLKMKIVLLLFTVTAGVFLFSAVNATRAVLIESGTYDSRFEMYDIGITLNENNSPIAWRSYNRETSDWIDSGETRLLQNINSFSYGVIYPEPVSVSNSGQIDEYVRVSVYKYWLNSDGSKATDLNPDLIHINYSNDENWILDSNYSEGPERSMYYYKLPLKGAESGTPETTSDLIDSIMLDGSIKNYVIQTETEKDDEGYTVVTNVYKYDGRQFCIEVRADAIQTHNAEDAALSAWGRKITITDGELNLD